MNEAEFINISRNPRFDAHVIPLDQLTDELINELNKLVAYWSKENRQREQQGWYINDPVEFNDIRKIKHQGASIGRLFVLYKKRDKKNASESRRKILAYILCYDNIHFKGTDTHFMNLLAPFVPHDYNLLNYAVDLQRIAFIYHFVRDPYSAKKKYGRTLLDMVIRYLKEECKIKFVFTSVDAGQRGIIQSLQSFRPNFFFFNYELSNATVQSMRLYGGEVLDQQTFRKRIVSNFNKKNIDFIVPMQLNLATESLRRMFKETGTNAEIVWTSFFHNVIELHNLYDMKYVYHGFYQPLANTVTYNETFEQTRTYQIEMLKEISEYFRQKHNNHVDGSTKQVASLIPSLEKDAFEFFFINDDPKNHDFSHFTFPHVYSINDEGTVQGHTLHFSRDMVYTFLTHNLGLKNLSYGLEKYKSNGREK